MQFKYKSFVFHFFCIVFFRSISLAQADELISYAEYQYYEDYGYSSEVIREPIYFLETKSRNFCQVQGRDQMVFYAHVGAVQHVERATFDRAVSGYHNMMDCKWPDGLYRPKGGQPVYRLFNGNEICHVTCPEQVDKFGGWSQVRVIEGISIGAQRHSRGDCTDP